jgi:hypothetical protein
VSNDAFSIFFPKSTISLSTQEIVMDAMQCDFFKCLPIQAQFCINGIAGILLYLLAENAGATIGKALYFFNHP